MVLDFAAFMGNVVRWVAEETGAVTIQSYQSESRPPRPYASVGVLTGPMKVGSDDAQFNSLGVWEVSGPREITLQIDFFGTDAYAALTQLVMSAEDVQVREDLEAKGIVFVDATGIRNLSTLESAGFQTRAQIEVTFRVKALATNTGIGYIETVQLTNELDDKEIDVSGS